MFVKIFGIFKHYRFSYSAETNIGESQERTKTIVKTESYSTDSRQCFTTKEHFHKRCKSIRFYFSIVFGFNFYCNKALCFFFINYRNLLQIPDRRTINGQVHRKSHQTGKFAFIIIFVLKSLNRDVENFE